MRLSSCAEKLVITLLILAGSTVLVAGAAVYCGVYDVSALKQHLKPVYWLIEGAMRRSVRVRASSEKIEAWSAARRGKGLQIYHNECERCHGAPGVAPERWALGMMPVPASLTEARRKWTEAEIYWVVRNGLKMTAMPAWQHRLSEEDMWDVSLFVFRILPELTPAQYTQAIHEGAQAPSKKMTPVPLAPDAERGVKAMQQYGCVTCHVIPGVTGALSHVGPPLNGIASQKYIAGVLPNNAGNMSRWLRSPPGVKKGTAMPDLSVNEQDALDMAAYLGTLSE